MNLMLAFFLPLVACDGSSADDATPKPDDTAPDTDTDTTPPPDPATVPLAGACAQALDYGGFSVVVKTDETSVAGSVADGIVPASVLEELVSQDGCAVMRRNNPYCEPACGPSEVCDFDGTCLPYPENQDLGTVSIDGLAAAVVMDPVFPGNTYFNTSLPHPALAGGELLTLSMPGGVYGPVELHGVGIEGLDMTGVEWVLEDGVDLTISWPAPTLDVVRSEIAVQIAIDQHGVSPSSLRCTFADDGSGTIPGAVISALIDVGVTGFPNGAIERRTVDHAALSSGCMDFTVTAPRTVSVDVVGHTPCLSTADCPDGQTCDLELQICE